METRADATGNYPKQSTFAVGELIYPEGLDATFRVMSVGSQGIRIRRISKKAIVPREPFFCTFKGVKFKVVGWDHGREFTIHTAAMNLT